MELYEFAARTNTYLTDELFAKVHEEYMASDMDKDAFATGGLSTANFR